MYKNNCPAINTPVYPKFKKKILSVAEYLCITKSIAPANITLLTAASALLVVRSGSQKSCIYKAGLLLLFCEVHEDNRELPLIMRFLSLMVLGTLCTSQ